jgi:FtsH-binding integral membrane protein
MLARTLTRFSHKQFSAKIFSPKIFSARNFSTQPNGQPKVFDASLADAVSKKDGLNLYYKKVFQRTANDLCIVGASAAATGIVTAVAPIVAFPALIGGFGAGMVYLIKFGKKKPQYTQSVEPFGGLSTQSVGPKGLDEESSHVELVHDEERDMWVKKFMIAQGIVAGPACALLYPVIAPAIIATGLVMTGTTLGAMYFPSVTFREKDLSRFGPAIGAGLLGIVGISVGGIFIPALHHFSVYGGVLFFAAINVYDTLEIEESYKKGQVDHLSHSMNYVLNILNLFIRFLEIFAMAGKKD